MMRGAPQSGLARLICADRPPNFRRYARPAAPTRFPTPEGAKASSCQRRTVSGLTIVNVSRMRGAIR